MINNIEYYWKHFTNSIFVSQFNPTQRGRFFRCQARGVGGIMAQIFFVRNFKWKFRGMYEKWPTIITRIYHAHYKQVSALHRVQEVARWQNLWQVAKCFEKFRCSDFHENLHLSQFLCVESISEVCFPKKLIPGKFPGNRIFGRFFGIFEDLYGKTDANYLELCGNVN